MTAPAVFLDRDGTLNVDHDYVHKVSEWDWVPGAVEAVKGFNGLGFKVVVVSNQSGVARGKFAKEDVERLHAWAAQDAARQGARLDAFYFCPHGPADGCPCRKPRPGMLLQAREDLALDLARSFMVGDKTSDAEAGRAAGVRPLFVLTGHGREHRPALAPDVPVVDDLLAAFRWVEARA